MTSVVIGVDVGTTGTKSGAYRLDGSALITARAATELRRHGPGEVDQDPDALLQSAYAAVAECVARAGVQPGDEAALAVTGQMAGLLGIDAAKLPQIVASDSVIGSLTETAARRCGLRGGMPVAAGLADTAAGALAAGIVGSGQLLDTAGTAAVVDAGFTGSLGIELDLIGSQWADRREEDLAIESLEYVRGLIARPDQDQEGGQTR